MQLTSVDFVRLVLLLLPRLVLQAPELAAKEAQSQSQLRRLQAAEAQMRKQQLLIEQLRQQQEPPAPSEQGPAPAPPAPTSCVPSAVQQMSMIEPDRGLSREQLQPVRSQSLSRS